MLVVGEGTGQPDRGPDDATTGRGAAFRRPTAWAAPIAVALLAAGIALALRSGRRPEPAPPPPVTDTGAPIDTGGERAIGETLRQAGGEKGRWVGEVPGVDLAGLDSTRRAYFLASANAQRCTCGCGYTLAGCRVYDSSCEKSGPRVQALLDSVRGGPVAGPGR